MRNEMWNKKPYNNIEALRLALALFSRARTLEQQEMAIQNMLDIANMSSEKEIESALIQEGMWNVILNGIVNEKW
jgi:hypothetical protein|tara:strand:- start:120 stop:344 length:225 start_codon:yes stop_codon:yes gene_type:complete